jgi:hypothetical protein
MRNLNEFSMRGQSIERYDEEIMQDPSHSNHRSSYGFLTFNHKKKSEKSFRYFE